MQTTTKAGDLEISTVSTREVLHQVSKRGDRITRVDIVEVRQNGVLILREEHSFWYNWDGVGEPVFQRITTRQLPI